MSSISNDRELSPQEREVKAKQSYISPTFCDYGSLSKLTQNGAGSGGDGDTTAGMMMVCL